MHSTLLGIGADEIQTEQKMYNDILKTSGIDGAITGHINNLENMASIHSTRTRDRIGVFIDMTRCVTDEKKELLLEYIFVNKLYEFSIFYQFLTAFLSPYVETDEYHILPADLQVDYDRKYIIYYIRAHSDESHRRILKYFKENIKFVFKNYTYETIYSESDKIISIRFTKQ